MLKEITHNSFSLLCIFFFLGFGNATAQTCVSGQILVSIKPGADVATLVHHLSSAKSIDCSVGEKIADHLNIWLLRVPDDADDAGLALRWLRLQPEVIQAQYNHILTQRTPPALLEILPNDPLLAQQWQYNNTVHPDADLDADGAWNVTTGGVTPAGDTIVVAVIDGGVDYTHPDLQPNLWKNRAEIPNDGLDNDLNGYVDDYQGWNVWTQDDHIQGQGTSHGTPIAGIIGARGNNGIGVTGINWDTKMLFVAAGGTEASILAAYDYVLNARKRYNESNGAKGAFVVAVNNSFGQNYGQPADAPLWCAAFDSLGKAGIVSVAATANLAIDVDIVGDLPTGCPSTFLVSVTSLNKNNEKAGDAAWGATTIDLGSYGKDVYSTASGNTYTTFSGTSFAAPQVTGAIGLLYAAPCPNLISVAKINPAEAAKRIRELLLLTSVPTPSLSALTQNGGRLNLAQFLQTYQTYCINCPSPFGLAANTNNISGTAALSWFQLSNYQQVNLRWRVLGAVNWSYVENIAPPFILNELQSCTTYEFALQAKCSPTEMTDWSATALFTTAGCCSKPDDLTVVEVGVQAATLHWNTVAGAINYRVRLRSSIGDWQTFEATNTSLALSGLSSCTDYEAQVQTRCETGDTPYSASVFFMTKGCGSCLDATYCAPGAPSSLDEWIAMLQVDDWVNASVFGGPGYQNFTANSEVPVLELTPGTFFPTVITPGFNGTLLKQYFRIYVDFNADGDFNDAGELAFNPGFAHNGPMSGYLATPAFQTSGLTRMRVLMKFKGNTNTTLPGACDNFEFGQIEDYCVLLNPTSAVGGELNQSVDFKLFPQPASDAVTLLFPPNSIPEQADVTVFDASGKLVFQQDYSTGAASIALSLSGWPTGVYILDVKTDLGHFIRKLVVL